MKQKLLFLLIFVIFNAAGCSRGLVGDIYKHTGDGDNKESATAFIILSNIYLSENDIEKIKKDYEKEKNKNRKYYYEYLLAKRTQEEQYITAFINSSKDSMGVLMRNDSNWISVASPIYKQLAYYSKTNDDALNILFKLTKNGDGANLAIVAEDLFEIQKINAERFSEAARNAGVREAIIMDLIENE
ncbi:hypothetical protein MNBD_GAMMA20-219 [hydrothermal vent metagenome]|uniref:Uncharacterized protein n=1 Tax=hydrothermal vent metagenome TaxID=652676 RepID=A0A3B1AKP3_9ZZZZ